MLAATAVLADLVLATFLRPPHGTGPDSPRAPEDTGDPSAKTVGRLGSARGLLSLLAVGCPVCNKLVLVLLGTSGALTYWAPLQPLVAVVSFVLLAEAALRRLSTADACRAGPPLNLDTTGGGTAAPATVSTSEAQGPANPELLALARRDAADPLAVGSADAPVVLIEYSDFQCPFCGRFASESKPDLVRDYVDKGILRIEWRNFPVFGAESDHAGRAGWAAGQQNRFWQFHDEAYAEPRRRNAGDFSEDNLTARPGRPASRTSHGSRRT
ncbi:hypothetical protein GCM10010271_46780 [Streptomyces kurssanovii]|nr:hypothetical protein GCM10010271_46780 [Streptomyces kurssanovii]